MLKFAFEADEKHPGAEISQNISVFAKTAPSFSALSLPRFLSKKTRALLVLFSRKKSTKNRFPFEVDITYPQCSLKTSPTKL